ncbi:polysaccharide deacetylase [Corallococcus sp. H22C18031201]|uniref:polysaccharide deacetylase family protein n=1 Tax=Citreicoccus inhibens TaxID=2849499 RepID=UPI000E72AC46|nr:polysaccharide deacetylase family protein [Citreicoccus inhibens]MBU8900180.1 polysaccharide deacetylase family protein [Citreicoccus inhibens]RJS16405.1 polysaccharide deacetylase [Corallococcus sp. H22C18031201]
MATYQRIRSGGRRILIVSYHRVVSDFTGELQRSIPGLLISQETFRKHMEGARSAGYELVGIGDAVDVMSGRRAAKKDLCVVTFDDGYRDVYRYAFPILQQMGIPAIIYLPTAFVGTRRRFNHDRLFHLLRRVQQRRYRPVFDALPAPALDLLGPVHSGTKSVSAALDDFIGEYPTHVLTDIIDSLEKQLGGGPELSPEQGDVMDWDEVRRMARAGFEFGAHTQGHNVLTLEPTAVIEQEVLESKRAIEREVGGTVRDFAYCNGWYSDEIIRVLVANGFRSGVTTEDTPNRIGGDPFTLRRKVMWENFSVGVLGDYSSALTVCQLDDCFGALGMNHPVPGRRPQAMASLAQILRPEAGSSEDLP